VAVLLVEHLRAGDVGRHQIRRELDALERQIEDLGECLDQQRLGQPGDAGDQAVTAGEQGHQDLIDDGVLADDDLADFGEDTVATGRDALGHRGQFRLRDHMHQCVSE
jgi:hypothetical protein